MVAFAISKHDPLSHIFVVFPTIYNWLTTEGPGIIGNDTYQGHAVK